MTLRYALGGCALLVVLGLAACGPPATPPPAATPAADAAGVAAVPTEAPSATPTTTATPTPAPTSTPIHPLSIEEMRRREYPGSDITVEETLAPGGNYRRYIVSYRSEGLKIYALMTVPTGDRPEEGWPVVVFNHGYIPPSEYRPTERYIAYVDAFARSGYIVFRPDYRGHGSSEGVARGPFMVPDYTVDVLNAVASLRHYADADPQRIGMWGHSMGGGITLRAMVVSRDVKAGVIWAGTVGPYVEMLRKWGVRGASGTDELTARYGSPEQNSDFWRAISPNSYLADLSGPLQLHHGTADQTVPLAWSELLYQQVLEAGRPVELYTYEGDDHNISHNLDLALQRSVAFFDRYLK